MSEQPIFADRGPKELIETGNEFMPKFDEHGLIPAIATDAKTGDVLMFAFMNAEALAETINTRRAVYWSRSRKQLWRKGETSGNYQNVIEIRTDCDQDAIWIKVEMQGHDAACHVGYRSCFFRAVPNGTTVPTDAKAGPTVLLEHAEGKPKFEPKEVYGDD